MTQERFSHITGTCGHYGPLTVWCLVALLLVSVWGCGGGSPARKLSKQPTASVSADDSQSLNQLQQENEQLRQRIEILTHLPETGRGKALHTLESVRLTKFTGLYDKDEDGLPEKLIVYLKPIDAQGDIVKAPGAVEVELWHLDAESDSGLVKTWRVEPDELATMWYATLVTINYRLVFELPPSMQDKERSLTVKIRFVDHLSGQVFTRQSPLVAR